MPAGIRTRHQARCRSRGGGRCSCRPAYEAWVFSKRDEKKIRKTFTDLAEAKGWRSDAEGAVKRRTLRAAGKVTLREAGEAWLEGAKAGRIETRSGRPFKPSALRGYAEALELRVYPFLGARRLSDIDRRDLQALVDRIKGECSPSTVRNTIVPVRSIFRYAIEQGDVSVNPTANLRLPAVRGKRDRVADSEEAATLLAALPVEEKALWAMALYTGLRRGELQALAWSEVDLDGREIRVQRSWDVKAGLIEPKSEAGTRTVPIIRGLREHLLAHKLRQGRGGRGLVFGRTLAKPFTPNVVLRRAKNAWRVAELEPIGLHECRHSFASLMISAGANAKALAEMMGHSSITVTFDRYGHLMRGSRDEAARLLEGYLGRDAS
jgi:integrase